MKLQALGKVAMATALAGSVVGLAGCGSSSAATSTSSSASSSKSSSSASSKVDKTPIVIAFPSSPDVGDLPMLVAIANMKKMGYNVSFKTYSSTPVATDAVISNNAQIVTISPAALFKADAQGNHLVAFGEKFTNEFGLVTSSKYKTVQDLNGIKLGLASPTSSTHTLVLWTQQHYNVKPNIVYVGNSAVRAKALLGGQLDATVLELDDVVKVLRTNPKGFHLMINYATALPKVLGLLNVTNATYLKAHPTIIGAFQKELIATYKQAYAHPNTFIKAAPKYLVGYSPSVVKQTMQESIQEQIWGPKSAPGSMTTAAAKYTLQFFIKTGEIPASYQTKLGNLAWFNDTYAK